MNLIVALITVADVVAGGVLIPAVHRLRELLAALDECFQQLLRDLMEDL